MKHYDWNAIQEYYNTGNSMRKITEEFGVSHKALSNASKRGDFSTRSLDMVRQMKKAKMPDKLCLRCGYDRGNNLYFCSSDCHIEFYSNTYIERWKKGFETGITGKMLKLVAPVRQYIFEKYENKCCECGWCKVHPVTKKIPLQIDHIDGDATNNKEENLRLICPNCHSLTSTFGSLNNGSGRKARRDYYQKENPPKSRNSVKARDGRKTQQQRNNEYKESQQHYIELILGSNIDFSKSGWVTKVAKIIDKKPGYVRRWMSKIMPDFLLNCYTDIRTGTTY